MAYSRELEKSIDYHMLEQSKLIKKRMFGGVSYLLNGNVCFGIYKDFLVLRTTKEKADKLLKIPGIMPFDVTGRALDGWVMIGMELYRDAQQLYEYLAESLNFAASLPEM